MADDSTEVDPQGLQPDVKSLQSLVGALVPALVIGIIYLVVWWFFTRHRFRDVYDSKRRRLDLLQEESQRSSTGRQPSTRGWPRADVGEATDAEEEYSMVGWPSNATGTSTNPASAVPPVALTMAPVPPPPPQASSPPQPSAPNVPPVMCHNPVRWLSKLWHTSEHTLIGCLGADAYIFLRFLRLGY